MSITRRRLLRTTASTFPLLLFGASQADERSQPENETATLVHADIARAMQSAELSMLFQGQSAVECRAWQQQFRAKVMGLLGDSTPPADWQMKEVSHDEFDDHTRYELLLTAKDVPSLPVYLLVPEGSTTSQRAPAVLCVHGHGPYGHHPIVGRRDLEGVAENIAKNNCD